MTVFNCCGLSANRLRVKRGDSDGSFSESQTPSDIAAEGFNEKILIQDMRMDDSLEAHNGSVHRTGSVCYSSQGSCTSLRLPLSSLDNTSPLHIFTSRNRKGSITGRHSNRSSSSTNKLDIPEHELLDHDHLIREVTRLRRALELTENELISTESELHEALLVISSERETHRRKGIRNWFHHHNEQNHHIPSPSKWDHRKRSGSCPHVSNYALPEPSSIIFSAIKSIVDKE